MIRWRLATKPSQRPATSSKDALETSPAATTWQCDPIRVYSSSKTRKERKEKKKKKHFDLKKKKIILGLLAYFLKIILFEFLIKNTGFTALEHFFLTQKSPKFDKIVIKKKKW